MIKKKGKSKTAGKKTAKRKGLAKPRPETNPVEVRKEVSKMVAAEAPGMAKAVIDEAKKGQLAPTKYLFEMASIYPPAPDGSQATSEEDCLAKMLLDALKLAAKPAGAADDGAGSGMPAEDPMPAAKEDEGDSEGDEPVQDKTKPEGEAADPAPVTG